MAFVLYEEQPCFLTSGYLQPQERWDLKGVRANINTMIGSSSSHEATMFSGLAGNKAKHMSIRRDALF